MYNFPFYTSKLFTSSSILIYAAFNLTCINNVTINTVIIITSVNDILPYFNVDCSLKNTISTKYSDIDFNIVVSKLINIVLSLTCSIFYERFCSIKNNIIPNINPNIINIIIGLDI